NEIENYCNENQLSFEKLQEMSKVYSKDFLAFQYFGDPKNYSNEGLNDETPLPVVLIINIENSKVKFAQTEFTKKYLAKNS
ncbi:MAG: hypothetical protein ACI4XH_03730, partial [Acutalibacteraceae bacterium]